MLIDASQPSVVCHWMLHYLFMPSCQVSLFKDESTPILMPFPPFLKVVSYSYFQSLPTNHDLKKGFGLSLKKSQFPGEIMPFVTGVVPSVQYS